MTRLRRSVLFVPADRPRAIEKALGLACDAIIFDLEDAVDPAARPAALAALLPTLALPRGHREVMLRLPGGDPAPILQSITAWPDAIVLPKVETPAEIAAAEAAMIHAPDAARIFIMIETPRGLLNLPALSAAGGRLAGLIAGTNDLAAALRCASPTDRWPLVPHLASILAAARAHGLVALDGVCNRFDDPAIVAAEAGQGAALGFDGKTLIHPAQIEPANRAFAPAAEAMAQARGLIAAWAARPPGKAVAVFEGALVERMHAEAAERLLAAGEG